MPAIMIHDYDNEKRLLSEKECAEVYNALCDRVNALKASLLPDLPERVRESLTQSLADCEKLVEVFE